MNKYLVKCAELEKTSGFLRSIGGAITTLGKNIFGGAKTLGSLGFQGLKTQTSNAFGGGILRQAQQTSGIKNPEKLLKYRNSFSGRKQMLSSMRGRTSTTASGMKPNTVGSTSFKFAPEGVKNPGSVLRNQQNAARLGLGLGVAGTAYAGNKILNNISGNGNVQSQEYPQYY